MSGCLTDHFFAFDFRALGRSTLNARVPESQQVPVAQLLLTNPRDTPHHGKQQNGLAMSTHLSNLISLSLPAVNI